MTFIVQQRSFNSFNIPHIILHFHFLFYCSPFQFNSILYMKYHKIFLTLNTLLFSHSLSDLRHNTNTVALQGEKALLTYSVTMSMGLSPTCSALALPELLPLEPLSAEPCTTLSTSSSSTPTSTACTRIDQKHPWLIHATANWQH